MRRRTTLLVGLVLATAFAVALASASGNAAAWAVELPPSQNVAADVSGDVVGVAQSETEQRALEATPVATVLTLSAPSTCNAKQAVRVVASLTTTDGVPVPGMTVEIRKIVAQSWVVLGTGKTDANGTLAVSVAPTSRIIVEAYFGGAGEILPSTSVRRSIKPRVLLGTPWTHDKIAYPGQRLPARGSLWPPHATGRTSATTIVCERYENGKWVTRASFSAKTVNTKSGTRYSGVFKFPSSGTWRVRARHSDGGHAVTLGPARTIKVTNWPKRYRGKKIGGFSNKKKMVAITIDDGPNHRTMEICSILEKYDAKGTFFFTRQLLNRGNRWQARRAYDRGHEIANHTANHKMLTGSYRTSYSQAYLPMATIRASTGFDPIWVRAMGGGVDRTGMRAVVNTGQLYCNWSVDSYDSHARYTPPSVLYRNVMRAVNSGDVILIHQTHPETVRALPAICRALKRRGYKMVTLSELAANSTAR